MKVGTTGSAASPCWDDKKNSITTRYRLQLGQSLSRSISSPPDPSPVFARLWEGPIIILELQFMPDGLNAMYSTGNS